MSVADPQNLFCQLRYDEVDFNIKIVRPCKFLVYKL